MLYVKMFIQIGKCLHILLIIISSKYLFTKALIIQKFIYVNYVDNSMNFSAC